MNMKTRLKGATIGAAVVLVIFGAGAFAQQTSTVPVTVGTVNGTRSLQVTGSNGTDTVGGPVSLAFGNTATSAPFGVVVADVLYKRDGYHVYSEMSHLYPLQPDGTVDCTATAIPSGAFTVGSVDQLATTGIDGVFETFLDFADANIDDDLTGPIDAALTTLGVDLTGTPVQVNDIPGLLERVRDEFSAQAVTDILDSLTLMDRSFTASGGTFTSQDEHPECTGSGSASASKAYLQHAAATSPDAAILTSLTSAIFNEASGDGSLLVDEAMGVSLLPPNSDTTGTLYQATASAVEDILLDAGLDPLLVTNELSAVTNNVIDDLVATSADLALSLVGQTGVYPSVQTLNLDRSQMGSPDTGIYHGVMTVTLIDDPDNDGTPPAS